MGNPIKAIKMTIPGTNEFTLNPMDRIKNSLGMEVGNDGSGGALPPGMGYQSFDQIPASALQGIGSGFQQNIKDDFAAGKYAGATPEMWNIMLGKMRDQQQGLTKREALAAPHLNEQLQQNMAYAQALRQPRIAQPVPVGPNGEQYGARVAAPQFPAGV